MISWWELQVHICWESRYLNKLSAELCASEHGFTRQDQDDYAISSYTRAQNATAKGAFKDEICEIIVKGSRGKADVVVSTDDEVKNVYSFFEKVAFNLFLVEWGKTSRYASSIQTKRR